MSDQRLTTQSEERPVVLRLIVFGLIMVAALVTLALMFVHPPLALGVFFATLIVVGIVWAMTRLIHSAEDSQQSRMTEEQS